MRKKVKNNDDNDNDSEDGNIGPIEFSSLNQTSAEEITEFINKLIAKNVYFLIIDRKSAPKMLSIYH